MPFLCASARNSASFIVRSKATRKASLRSTGMAGGATNGRPMTCRLKISFKICLCSSFWAKSVMSGTSGKSGAPFQGQLNEEIEFLLRQPVAFLPFYAGPGPTAAAVDFAALHGERQFRRAGISGNQSIFRAEQISQHLCKHVRVGPRAGAADGEGSRERIVPVFDGRAAIGHAQGNFVRRAAKPAEFGRIEHGVAGADERLHRHAARNESELRAVPRRRIVEPIGQANVPAPGSLTTTI